MKLTIIGCSGSFAGPQSPASSYLVQSQHEGRTVSILLDLGNGALGALQRHLDPSLLDAVFISHLHPDHCIDLTGLYVYRKYHPDAGPFAPLPVHAPIGAEGRIRDAYEGMGEEAMHQQFAFHEVTAESAVRVGPFTVTPIAVNHPVPAFGYRVEAGGSVLAYTGDTDSCESLHPLCEGADLVLADSAFVEGRDLARGIHLTGRRAAQAAVAAGARRLMLTHIPAWNDPQVCRAQASEVWPGEVELAEPDATYHL